MARRGEDNQNPSKPGRYGSRSVRNDDLDMQCWCRSEIIPVSRERVRECSGVSCGRTGCHPPGQSS